MVGDCDTLSDDVPAGSMALARPKSRTFTVPSGRSLMFAGFRVAMDDALLVRRFERLCDLSRDRQRFVEGNRPLRNPIGERRPVDQLHDERLTPSACSRP